MALQTLKFKAQRRKRHTKSIGSGHDSYTCTPDKYELGGGEGATKKKVKTMKKSILN